MAEKLLFIVSTTSWLLSQEQWFSVFHNQEKTASKGGFFVEKSHFCYTWYLVYGL